MSVNKNSLTNVVNELLSKKPSGDLRVNGKVFPKIIGTKTEYGHYSNGWDIKNINGDGKWFQLNIITSNDAEVTFENRILFKKTSKNEWVLKKVEGFNGFDLMAVDSIRNVETYVIEYIKAFLKR